MPRRLRCLALLLCAARCGGAESADDPYWSRQNATRRSDALRFCSTCDERSVVDFLRLYSFDHQSPPAAKRGRGLAQPPNFSDGEACGRGKSYRVAEVAVCEYERRHAACDAFCERWYSEALSPITGEKLRMADACYALCVVDRGDHCSFQKLSSKEAEKDRPSCFHTLPWGGKGEGGAKHRPKKRRPAAQKALARVFISSGYEHSIGSIATAHSVLASASDPSRVALFFATDASEKDVEAFLRPAMRCALGAAASFSIATIDEAALARLSPAVGRLLTKPLVAYDSSGGLRKSPANYGRFFMHLLFPDLKGHRVLYLDDDVLVAADVLALFESDLLLGGAVLAATNRSWIPGRTVAAKYDVVLSKVTSWDYKKLYVNGVGEFNAGVALYDLGRWEAAGMSERVEAIFAADFSVEGKSGLEHPTQTPLNLAVESKYVDLGALWNCNLPSLDGRNAAADIAQALKRREACATNRRTRVRHFTGKLKPWLYQGRLRFLWLAHARPVAKCFINITRALPHLFDFNTLPVEPEPRATPRID
ncbi:nucleotide-diphospho-sugar transferase [Pelagophyceae sp. CCMP2097]|nr:nucleotide-diphospho-sugar transferase [Pelagophyceae sp. CCMP2097]